MPKACIDRGQVRRARPRRGGGGHSPWQGCPARAGAAAVRRGTHDDGRNPKATISVASDTEHDLGVRRLATTTKTDTQTAFSSRRARATARALSVFPCLPFIYFFEKKACQHRQKAERPDQGGVERHHVAASRRARLCDPEPRSLGYGACPGAGPVLTAKQRVVPSRGRWRMGVHVRRVVDGDLRHAGCPRAWRVAASALTRARPPLRCCATVRDHLRLGRPYSSSSSGDSPWTRLKERDEGAAEAEEQRHDSSAGATRAEHAHPVVPNTPKCSSTRSTTWSTSRMAKLVSRNRVIRLNTRER